MAGGESLLSDTPKPTEEIFDSYTSCEPNISDCANDKGYEPDDKTTLDEVSISECEDDGDKKKKRKRKRKQKIKVKESEDSEIPRSLEDSTPAARTSDEDAVKVESVEAVDSKKGKKRKRGKKDEGRQDETQEVEVEGASVVIDEEQPLVKEQPIQEIERVLEDTLVIEPESLATPPLIVELEAEKVSTPIEVVELLPKPELKKQIGTDAVLSPDGSYRSMSEISEPDGVKIIEELVIRSPQSEAGDMNSQLIITVPIFETTLTVESTVQTSPEVSEVIQVEERPRVFVENISAQTSPEVPTETSSILIQTDKEPEISKLETAELSTQVKISDVVPATEDFSQTSTPDKPEEIVTAEISMQTTTPDKVELLEGSMQTVSPDIVEITRSDSAMQTTLVELQEECAQTLTPEPIVIPETTELSVQTERRDDAPKSIQTSPEPQIVTSEQSMQTISPEIPKEVSEVIIEQPVKIIATSETTSQTTPIIIKEEGEVVPIVTQSPEFESYEIQIQTTVTVPGEEKSMPSKTIVIDSAMEEPHIPLRHADDFTEKGQAEIVGVAPKSIDSATLGSDEKSSHIIKLEKLDFTNVPTDETTNLLKTEETISTNIEPINIKSKKSKRKQKEYSKQDNLSESPSDQDYSLNITVQGVPVDTKYKVDDFMDAERQQSEGFLPAEKSKSKSRKDKHDKKKQNGHAIVSPDTSIPILKSENLLDPRPSYSDIAKRPSRSSSPVDELRNSPESETEPSSIVIGKVITDIDTETVKMLSKKQQLQLESLSSKDSDSSTLIASDSSKEMSPSPDFSSLESKPITVHATISNPAYEIENLTIEIKETEPVILRRPVAQETKTKPAIVKPKTKSKYKTSVTIEEVMSPTEIADTPLTPSSEGPLSPPNLNYPTSAWSKPDSQQFIESEKQPLQHPVPVQDVGIKWKHAAAIERVKNLQNARRTTHLSDVLYLATMNEVVTDESIEQKNNDVQQNLNVLKEAVARQDIIVIQQTIITTVDTITTWLETIEYRIYLNRQQTSHGPSEERVKEFGDLKVEILNIEQSVGELQGALDNARDLCNEDDKSKIESYINSLQEQIKVIEEVTHENEQQATQDLSRWIEFVNGVNNVSRLVHEVKQQLDSVTDSDSSPSWKLQELEKIENSNRCHMLKTVHLIATARRLMRDFPSREIPQEMYNSHELTRYIDHIIGLEREKVLQLLSLADEYEQTLKEFAQITDVADALVESSLSVSDLEHLQEEMQKHRKFFVNLSHCRAILESLEGNLDLETRALHSNLHRSLHERATIILDKAAFRSQQMALAASRWTVLEQGMREETRWLQVAQQRVPDLSTVTSVDYDQYINLYQSLSLDIAHHHAKLAQLNSVAQKLQELVTCVGLEQTYGDALQVILKLQEDVNKNLKRLIAFRETWSTYNLLTDKLEYWMREAEMELVAVEVPESSKIQPGHMRQFWELKAQYEVHNNVRNEAGNTFEQAMSVIPVSDEMIQRQFRAELQDRWQNVSTRINDIQTAVIENISAPDVSINEKLVILEEELQELKIVVDELHGIIKNEEELNLYIERLQVMSSRIETIQNELGRVGLLSTTESEKVGYLLSLSKRLEIQISEELEGAYLLKEKLHAIKRGLSRVRKNHQRVSRILDDCESCEKLGSDVVEKAVNDCQEMGEELVAHWQDLMGLRQLLHTLPMRLRLSVSPVKVEREISQLQDEHTALERRCGHLLALLRNRLALWNRFEHQLEMVQQSVQEADYMMELLTVQGSVDYERLRKATERLEGLNSNFTSREQLISELRTVAEPLQADCDPEVSAKVEAAVQEAVTAWQDTCTNLRDLCTRYQDAVKLWKQYREASDQVRAWADQQMGTVTNLKPEEALKEVKVCEETLSAHMERLTELRGLVAQIAADVGLDAGGLLQGEVESLGKRLEDVRESLTTLADVAESRAANQENCNGELEDTRTFLNNVQKSLSNVEKSNEENCEQQLVALRNHLLALGKTDSQIQTIKDKSIEMTQTTRTETSIIEILELWQTVFRETFQQYHRLSTQLVKSQDSAVALKLWQEYLLHVQAFLSSTIPEDYHSLTEHQHLCQVHQNLLTTQQNVFVEKTHDDISSGDGSVMEQFNILTGLHNDTLSKIVERHQQVSDRLTAWDQYRTDQTKLLSWLKDMERERGRLQLRYIHVRRVPKVLTRIQSLLDKVPSGEEQAQNLQQQQIHLLRFCDDALATSIRMEHSAMVQRISNLQAALETWKEFLLRIMKLSKNYDERVDKIQTMFQEMQEIIVNNSQDVPVFHSGIQNRLDNLRMVRTRVGDLTRDLEELGVTQEELKECVSPADMKTINQRLWLLWQQQGDLDHQLAVLCHHLEEKSDLKNMFEARQTRFVTWATEVEHRLNEKSEPGTIIMRDPEDILKQLETELHAEMTLKEREVDWLLHTGQELLQACGEEDQIFRENVRKRVEDVRDGWQRLQNLGKTKANKLHDIIQTMSQLEIRIAEIKAWLYQMESQLSTPLVFEACTQNIIDQKLQEHEKLKKSIEKESGNVAEVFNLCELLLSDVDTWKVHFNTENITKSIEGLEKRWKAVCGMSEQRKRRITSVWTLLQEILRLSSQQEQWVSQQELQLQEIDDRLGDMTRDQMQSSIYKIEKQIKEIESRAPTLEILEQTYSKLAKASSLEPENLQHLTVSVKVILSRWNALTPRAMDLLQKLQREMVLYREFVTAHGKAVVSLTQVDVQLTQVQHLATPDQAASPSHRLEQIKIVENELQSFNELLGNADKLGLLVLQKCQEDEVSSVQEMIDEYQNLWKDIKVRITQLRERLEFEVQDITKQTRTEVDESIQVDTLKFEQDSAVQVNTLPPLVRMTSITSKDAYIYELDTAISECTTNVSALEAIVNSPIPQQGSPEIHTSGRTLAKLIATCQSSIELVRHLNSLLLSESNATDEEAKSIEVNFQSDKFDELLLLAKARELKIRELSEAGRLLCPLCTSRNWQQLDNDLWRLEKWLEHAEGTQSAQHTPPSHIEQLEDVIQDHREFLLDLDSHRSIVRSLNIVGTHLADHTEDTSRANHLRSRLETDNKRWESVCRNAAKWQTLLQTALMDNRQFHQTIDELCAWLEKTEATIRASEPVDLTADTSVIDAKFLKFIELRAELERCEPRVMSLQEAADQLLRNTDSPAGAATTYTRLTDLRLRLQSLRRLTSVYILKLGAVLGRDPNEINVTLVTPATSVGTSLHSLSYDLLDQASTSEVDHTASTDQPLTGTGDEEEINTSVLTRGYRFLGRVVRASLPIQALMLLLLGVASLVPTGEDDYSCTLTNNFARSFEPMLRYPNGPPPI